MRNRVYGVNSRISMERMLVSLSLTLQHCNASPMLSIPCLPLSRPLLNKLKLICDPGTAFHSDFQW